MCEHLNQCIKIKNNEKIKKCNKFSKYKSNYKSSRTEERSRLVNKSEIADEFLS